MCAWYQNATLYQRIAVKTMFNTLKMTKAMEINDYIEKQLKVCREINAAKSVVTFETLEWELKIEVRKKISV